jgi:spore maturation protein CgeB
MACGIPLVCSPWSDDEGLFPPDTILQVSNGGDMAAALRAIMHDSARASDLAHKGLAAIRAGHTCGHRVEQLLQIVTALNVDLSRRPTASQRHAVEAVSS